MHLTYGALDWLPDRFGWTAELPADCPTFLGHRLRLSVQTRSTSEDGRPPLISAVTTELIDQILAHIQRLAVDASVEFSDWAARRNGLLDSASIRDPHLWLEQERIEAKAIEDEGVMDCCPGLFWTFVVGFVDAPDYGVHMEFTGLQHVETWAGD